MKEIKLIAIDVDGTLTDGKIYYDSNGNEMKAFNAKDGMAISQAVKLGINIAIITGRESEIVSKRAEELGVKYVFQGVHNKLEVLFNIMKELNILRKNVMFIGDDINDLECINNVGIGACPKDSVKEVQVSCKYISKYNGGNGAVREIVENVLREQGKWDKIINNYIGSAQ